MVDRQKVKHWSVKRSGSSLTIKGVDIETGRTVTITGVREVYKAKGLDNVSCIVASFKEDKQQIELV